MASEVRYGIDAASWSSGLAYARAHPEVEIVCGYTDGAYVWPQSAIDQVRAMGKTYVAISSVGTDTGEVLDCEPGNPNAVQSVNWVLGRRAAGIDPTVYVAQWAPGYTWSDVLNAHAARGVAPPMIWAAPWPSAVIPPGSIGSQYLYPGSVDLDVFNDDWPPGSVAPAPQASPTEVDVAQVIPITWNGYLHTFSVDGNGNLPHRWWTGTGWGSEILLTGVQPNDTPGVIQGLENDPNRIDVFVRASASGPAAGQQIHAYFTDNSWHWDAE